MVIKKQGNRNFIFTLLTGLYLIIGLVFSVYIIQEGINYKRDMKNATDIQNFEERLLNAKEWIYPHYEWSGKKKKAEETIAQSKKDITQAYYYSLCYLVVSLVYVVLVKILLKRSWNYRLFISLSWITVALFCLLVGIFFPMLEISAYSQDLKIPLKLEVPLLGDVDLSKNFEGRMYYYYQCKSIADLLFVLFESGNILVGLAILCFSLLMPLSKILLSVLLLLSERFRTNKFIIQYVNNVGKWSMADVFVASAFLAYLSFYNMNTGIDTETKTLPGLYYFFMYVVISIFSSYQIKNLTIQQSCIRIPENIK